jgi:hypothetical protein
MNPTLTTTRLSTTNRPSRSASPVTLHRILFALAAFAGIGIIGLGIALITGAVVVFNILVFTVFTVFWIAFAAALAFSPGTLDDLWLHIRRLPLVIQGIAWLLFLPIMVGLWIWERTWAWPIRLVLVLALGTWNIFLFLPRSL